MDVADGEAGVAKEYALRQERERKARYERVVLDSIGGEEFLRKGPWRYEELRYLAVSTEPVLFIACVLKRRHADVTSTRQRQKQRLRQGKRT